MKPNPRCRTLVFAFLLTTGFFIGVERSGAAHRYHPAYPRGVDDSHGVTEPRSPAETRGAAEPRSPEESRGAAEPRRPAAYVHSLPTAYETRVYDGLKYYYADGAYYYEYANDGPAIYVPATMVGGVPTVPPRPYLYTLPAGYSIRNYAGVNYYYYYGYYYYVYYINGQAVYVLAAVAGGTPSVPPPPY